MGDKIAQLSERERAIAERYANGESYKEIAAALFIAPATVRNHLAAIYRKLDVKGKPALINALAADTAGEPGSSADETPSIAVLPFTNMSRDPEQDYFSDGLTEDIITELSHHRDFFVIARSSSFSFKGQSPDVVEVGKKLNARYVLEGSIRKSGSRIRVTAQLIDASTGTHIWADRYDRDVEDIFAVQDEVVHTISATLVGRLEQAGHEVAKRKPPSSLKAYECVVHGLSFLYKWTPADNQKALNLFERATAIDPGYAPAYAWLAHAHFRAGLNAWSTSLEKSMADLFDCASRAVEIDDNDSRTHTSLGLALLFRAEHDLARYHLEHALSLNPSDTDAMVHLARCEALAGNPAIGVEKLIEATRFNPLANYNWFAGQVHYIARRYTDAIDALASLSSPTALVHAFLAAAYAQRGDEADARRSAALFISTAEAATKAAGAPTPSSWIEFVTVRYPFKRPEDAEHLASGLRMAGLS